jgi:hypothetical protein
MLVSDFIDNNSFDVNCYCDIYDCTDGNDWRNAKLILTIYDHASTKPLDEIEGMKIKYVTTNGDRIVIEAAR